MDAFFNVHFSNPPSFEFSSQVGLSKNGDIVILPAYANKGNSSSTSSLHHRRGGHHHLPSSRDEWFWIKSIQFAPDCHVQNARICRWQSDAVILQATKQIPAGDELFLWFGEDVLVNDLGIPPYLNPQNIRGMPGFFETRTDSQIPNRFQTSGVGSWEGVINRTC